MRLRPLIQDDELRGDVFEGPFRRGLPTRTLRRIVKAMAFAVIAGWVAIFGYGLWLR